MKGIMGGEKIEEGGEKAQYGREKRGLPLER